ncbi:MAG: coenzyme F420-0:L-glutamate ligase [Candidatus Heimdallarchaeota archaeon]
MEIKIIPIPNLPIIREGDDIGTALLKACEHMGLKDGDILVIAHTIVSRAEGRVVQLSEITPSVFAEHYAKLGDKDPRQVEVVLREAKSVIRMTPTVLITETQHGLICANSAVDRSNSVGDSAILLPENPDRSAREIHARLAKETGLHLGVIISDTFGRPFRAGTINVAVGLAGVAALEDFRGRKDLFGKELTSTIVARADELACSAGLIMGQADEGIPAVIIRGASSFLGAGEATELLREPTLDIFR